MKRLNTINLTTGSKVVDYKLPTTPKSPYVVDDSCFVPMAEAIKQLKTNQISASEIETCYDFPNGRDTGKEIPVTRKHGYSDITEISQAIMEDTARTVEEIEKGRAKKRYQDKLDKQFSEINNSVNKSDLNNSTSVKE